MRVLIALLFWAGAAEADKVADLWQGGAVSAQPGDQLDRALWLYELGAADKADQVLEAWVAVMPEAADLPEGFADLDADPDLLVAILVQHLARGDRKALPVLQYWLDHDRMVGWRVWAEMSDHYSGGAGQPIISGIRVGDQVGVRLPEARRLNRAAWDR